MSDFNFDEIDKAVNGALENDDAAEARGSLGSSREDPPVRATSSMPAARRASGGRFMDMVHPSSDMRREGNGGNVPPAPVVPPKPTETASSTTLPEPPVLLKTPGQNSVAPTADTPDTVAGNYETVADWATPLESPFLPGAKVEKRPLGGAEPTAFSLNDSLLEEPEDVLLEAPEEELRLEASNELLLEVTAFPDPIDFSADKEGTETDNDEVVVEVVTDDTAPETETFTSHDTTPAVYEEEPVGPASITQQYREQPVVEQESGAIYDTESYHQALAPPVKKHSALRVIVWEIGRAHV